MPSGSGDNAVERKGLVGIFLNKAETLLCDRIEDSTVAGFIDFCCCH